MSRRAILLVAGLVLSRLTAAAQPADTPQGPPDVILYFPPAPPSLGSAISAPGPGSSGPPAPAALAAYANDPFYALVGALLVRNQLTDEFKNELDGYETEKASLLAELRARLDTLREADAATREQGLEAFARGQTPRIAALEQQAEDIRLRLASTPAAKADFFRWRLALGSKAAPASPNEEKQAMLASLRSDVFYREGLSPDERRLLRELADRLAEPAPSGGASAYFHFAPEGAPIPLRADFPAELRARIDAYQKEKSALTNELVTELWRRPSAPNDPRNASGLSALAKTQAPRFSALQEQAEAIRRELAAIEDPDLRRDLPAMPSDLKARIGAYKDLQARIDAYHEEKMVLQKALFARVEEVQKDAGSADPGATADRIRETISDFTRENANRYTALDRSKDSIRADLEKLPGGSTGTASTDALIASFAASLRQLASYWDYRDYRNAVLQPGLSPEQRRLLFDAALARLNLPLPAGESLFKSQ